MEARLEDLTAGSKVFAISAPNGGYVATWWAMGCDASIDVHEPGTGGYSANRAQTSFHQGCSPQDP